MTRFLAAVAIVVAFAIANRAAFEGFFSDDDLDNLSWATIAGTDTFAKELVSPWASPNNTRPVGAYYYRWMGRSFGLEFSRYIPPLWLLHLANAGLLAWLLRRRACPEQGIWAATILFLFHASLLDAWWKPMFIFDLTCGTFCLLTWLVFGSARWYLALPLFWLAYKSKEVALFFPLVLAIDNWRRALPFLAISLSFGLQAMRLNLNRDNNYTLRFETRALWTTIPFYAKHALLNKWGALVLLPTFWFARQRETLLGLAGASALLLPLLFLPGRLFAVYLYVPMIAACVGLAFAFARMPRWPLAAGFSILLALHYQSLRDYRKSYLAIAQETHAWVQQLQAAYAIKPLGAVVFHENSPRGFQLHGMRGALRLITRNPAAEVLNPQKEEHRLRARAQELPELYWFAPRNTLEIRPRRYAEAKQQYLEFGVPSSVWQLAEGWYERDGNSIWASTDATLQLAGSPQFRTLQVQFNVGRRLIEAMGKVETKIYVNDHLVAAQAFDRFGTPVMNYPLPAPLPEGPATVRIVTQPGYVPPGDGRRLGIAIIGIGLLP
jgi:hypothetical protein